MKRTTTPSQKKTSTSFSSMSDDFLEARFSPEYREEFQARLMEWDERKTSVKKAIFFEGEFDGKTEKAIRNLIQQLFIFSSEYKLDTGFNIPEIFFFTPTSWRNKKKRPVPKDQPLPAASLEETDNLNSLNLILPGGTMSSEQVINTVRLLISKIFGEIFFKVHVHHRVPYSRMLELIQIPEFSTSEKARICRFSDALTNPLQKAWIEANEQPKLSKHLALKLGKKAFFELILKESTTHTTPKALDEWFDFYLSNFQSSPDQELQKILDKIMAGIQPSIFLLPHESLEYEQLLSNPWTALHALSERLKKVTNYTGQLIEYKEWFDSFKKEGSDFDHQTSQLARASLQNVMVQLQKSGLVKIFLIEYGHLTEKQEKEKRQFPLWIYQHILKYSETEKNVESQVNKITGQYTQSIYQKLFEACQRGINLLHMMEKQPVSNPTTTPNYKRLKSLLETINLLNEQLLDMSYSAMVVHRLFEVYQKDHDKEIHHIGTFEKAWSYFISFALVHQYYKVIKKKNESLQLDKKFHSAIQNFVEKQIFKKNEYRLVALFLNLYQMHLENLEKLLPVIKEECPVFDFIVFQADKVFKEDQLLEDAHNHATHITSWLRERAFQKVNHERLNF